ncbi:MAG: hypothetical protein COA45_10810 [Zetaproteobacteria bacterium]|nr:MAG: hypothetical protein COA45_10810 [Zetaproteobacteria bacterium]
MGFSLKEIAVAAGLTILSACATTDVDPMTNVGEIDSKSGCYKIEANHEGALQNEEQIVCPFAAPADENTL